jgi:hypothetical protein
VVNNAGIFVSKPFTEYTDADYDAIPESIFAAFPRFRVLRCP